MPTRSTDDLQDWVLQRLDEVVPDGLDQTVPASVVKEELKEAAIDAMEDAPQPLVYQAARAAGNNITSAVSTGDDYVTIPVPGDAVRLLRVKLEHWDVPIDEGDVTTSTSDVYLALLAGDVEPTTRVPAAALIPDVTETEGGRALRAWPVPDDDADAVLEELVYLPRTQPDEVHDDLQDAMVWYAAERVASGYLKDYGAAKVCEKQAAKSIASRARRADRLSNQAGAKRRTTRRARSF